MLSRWSCFWLSLLVVGSACGHQPIADHPTPPAKPIVRHLEIDRDDSSVPAHLASAAGRRGKDAELPQDTITKRGNFVRYLLTEDSCCADNVYIRWGNARFSRTYIMPRVRRYRSYFTPMLRHETKDYMILWHGCATDCRALLFLPLNKNEEPLDIAKVVGYDPQSYTVVHGLGNPEQENYFEFLRAINVKTRKTKRIVFKHLAMAAQQRDVIDSCRIDERAIYLKATLRLAEEREENVTEIVRLPNDIR
jgi:hypothetical protein